MQLIANVNKTGSVLAFHHLYLPIFPGFQSLKGRSHYSKRSMKSPQPSCEDEGPLVGIVHGMVPNTLEVSREMIFSR